MLDLFEFLKPHIPVLTPNRRLAAVFIRKYNAWQIQQGKTSWPSLDILPINSWINRLWQEYSAQQFAPMPFLLNPEAEQIIWETILRQSPDKNLLQVTGTAELARGAWGILKQWQVDFANPELQTTTDGLVFGRWAEQFMSVCRDNQWLATQSVASAVIENVKNGSITAPEQIILAGFTEVIPHHQSLLDACEKNHTKITLYSPERTQNTVQRISLIDETQEIHTMARWAKYWYEQDNKAMIGCVVPKLEKLRPKVIEIFSEVFAASQEYVLDATTLPFNISAGKSLALYPIIHIALQLLKLSSHVIPLDAILSIVNSPFLMGAESEQFARAALTAKLQQDNVASISLAGLIRYASAADCVSLAEVLGKITNSASAQKKQNLHFWVETFLARLRDLGWPGERNLNSAEYQTADTWLKVVADYLHFERFLGPVTYHEALHFLVYLTTAQIYQPESPETTIQILGALEAADIPFDYLWVMGMDDSDWPQAPKPNPFIPQRMQRIFNMPHATAERELAFTQQLTAQLRDSASHVIFSHASMLEDFPLRPSPIITDIAEITLADVPQAAFTPPATRIFNTRQLEKIQDDRAPAVGSAEKPRGGTSIFKNQAACPFKAFAESRLLARKQDPVTLGLRANQRGNILHKAMELLWETLGDQTALLQLSELEINQLIEQCIAHAIKDKAASKKANTYYLQLEALRLQKIISNWLVLEKERPYFKIKSLEEKRSTMLGNIPINVSADRIDELADGRQVIIDYKSGKNLKIANWFGDRPDEPQLPLYCILEPELTSAIIFALINPFKMSWAGVSDDDLDMKGVSALSAEKNKGLNWSEQLTAWKITLEQLAEDFYQGNALVDPKHDDQTCEHCHLHYLCRINEVINP